MLLSTTRPATPCSQLPYQQKPNIKLYDIIQQKAERCGELHFQNKGSEVSFIAEIKVSPLV